MRPITKIILKVLACHWFASIFLMYAMGMFEPGHPHVALANSKVFTALYAPFLAAVFVPLMPFNILDGKFWPLMVSYWPPFIAALAITFLLPRGLSRFSKVD